MTTVTPEPVRRSAIPWILLVLALALTATVAGLLEQSAHSRDRSRFDNSVQSTSDRISGQMETYVALLRGVGGLLAASEGVTAEEFRTYVERVGVPDRYPGVQGLGFSRRSTRAELPGVVAAVRAEGARDFRAWPDGPRDEYHTIVFLEPQDARNQAALGYDMFTDPVRRAAMERARDTGQPTASGRVTLRQEIDARKQAGFLVYLPVYRGGAVPATVEERREALLGFVYAPFRADDLFREVAGARRWVTFRIYDGKPSPANLLHDSGPDLRDGERLVASTRITIAGRQWTMVFRAGPGFASSALRPLAALVLLGGILASLLLFALAKREARARTEAERYADEVVGLASQLEDQAAELEQQVAQGRALTDELQATNERLENTVVLAEAARAAAEEANRARSRFLATMSHELRTPLNAIGGYAELLEIGVRGPVSDSQRTDLGRIRRAQKHLLGLINDVLDFAKLEAGRLEFHPADFPVAEVLADAEALIIPMARAKSITYTRGACDTRALVHADPERTRQILVNLLSNAVKFTQAGGHVTVEWTVADGTALFRVSDNGMGVPADKLEGIFEPFVQVDSDLTRTAQGTGLGLAISRELARAMGGELSVESTPEQGSTFILRLPAPVRG
jgi:signal transduction histidine kinase